MNEENVNITIGASSSNNQDGSYHQSYNQDGSHHQDTLANVTVFEVNMMMYNYFLSIIIYIKT